MIRSVFVKNSFWYIFYDFFNKFEVGMKSCVFDTHIKFDYFILSCHDQTLQANTHTTAKKPKKLFFTNVSLNKIL
jgi:hypothetical protein